MNLKKATEPESDSIPSKFIKMAAEFLYKPLSSVVKLSLRYRVAPKQMQVVRVRALYKDKGSLKVSVRKL